MIIKRFSEASKATGTVVPWIKFSGIATDLQLHIEIRHHKVNISHHLSIFEYNFINLKQYLFLETFCADSNNTCINFNQIIISKVSIYFNINYKMIRYAWMANVTFPIKLSPLLWLTLQYIICEKNRRCWLWWGNSEARILW